MIDSFRPDDCPYRQVFTFFVEVITFHLGGLFMFKWINPDNKGIIIIITILAVGFIVLMGGSYYAHKHETKVQRVETAHTSVFSF